MKERLFWIGCIVAIIIYFTKCNQTTCPEIKKVSSDTTILQGKDSIAWRTPQSKISYRTRIDSFIEINIHDSIREVDTAAILEDYFGIRYYEDTTHLEYATITTQDSITQNKLLRQKVSASWRIPVVTKTVTYMQPKKSEIYGGLNFGYNNVGANLIFKDTSNRIWEVGAIYSGKMYYYIGKKWKFK